MKKSLRITSIFLVVMLAFIVSIKTHPRQVAGWFAAGSNPNDYDMGVGTTEVHSGKAAAFIISKVPDAKGFGTYMQMTPPGKYMGKKVAISTYIKTRDVKRWAGLWFRVDGKEGKQLGFDNMSDRPIKGTTDWTAYKIVLDVPKGSEAIAFGVLLSGSGAAYIDAVKLDILGEADGKSKGLMGNRPSGPTNLDFQQ